VTLSPKKFITGSQVAKGRPSKRWMDRAEDLRRVGVTKVGKHLADKEWHRASLQRTENSGGSW